jgi:hypothetical protein
MKGMSIQIERPTLPCSVCGTQVTELRRSRCWRCYSHWADARPVGLGASCTICNDKRRDNLRLLELKGKSIPFCHNCAGRTIKLDQIPEAIDELRHLLNRDRRDNERRNESRDHRLFPRERRVGDRRTMGRSDHTDPHIFMPELLEYVIELEEDDIEVIEQTNVREIPLPRPL